MNTLLLLLSMTLFAPAPAAPGGRPYIDQDVTCTTYRLRIKLAEHATAHAITDLLSVTEWKELKRLPGKITAVKGDMVLTVFEGVNYATFRASTVCPAARERAMAVGRALLAKLAEPPTRWATTPMADEPFPQATAMPR